MNTSSIYIHVPFCVKKCGYCVFHSLPASNNSELISAYLDKLKYQIKINNHLVSHIESIYIGGGTPSSLSLHQLENLFNLILENYHISDNAEISIECNPESISDDKIKLISNFANRISFGVQSFNQSHRNILGRVADNHTILEAIESASKNNINNISIDLIYGIPSQSLNDWKAELNQSLQLPIKHISTYALTVEEGSELYSIYNTELNNFDEIVTDMYTITEDLLSANNIHRYEISNYSKPRFECKHNIDIWYGGKYLGLGPTASSFDGVNRWTQPTSNQWLNSEKPEFDIISTNQRILEVFMMGLRTTLGWNIMNHKNAEKVILKSPYTSNIPQQIVLNNIQTISDSQLCLSIDMWNNILERLKVTISYDLIQIKRTSNGIASISATEKGLLFWNEIAMALI